jgi:hypothetical protein
MNKNDHIPNSFQTPNILIDHHLQTLDPYEYTLISIIIRKTLGWHKEADAISVNQFNKIAPKLKIRTISDRLNNLERLGLVEIIRKTGRPNEYKLSSLFYKKGYAGDAEVGMQEMQTGYAGDAEVGMQEMQTGYAGDAYTKHTIQNTLIKPTFQKARQPTNGLWEVQLFFIEKGIADPLQSAWKFWNHYEACGWVQGSRSKPLKNWTAAVWSWDLKRSNGNLNVLVTDQFDETRTIEFTRKRIVELILSGNMRIQDNIFQCKMIKKIEPAQEINDAPRSVFQSIKKSLGPSQEVECGSK